MPVCAVPGCGSNSKVNKNYTFHRLPTSMMPRAQWFIALGVIPNKSHVCSRHFEASMFTQRSNNKLLLASAVPTLFLQPVGCVASTSISEATVKQSPDATERSDEATESGEVLACRVCLAVDGRLYAISGSGLEDALVAVTGETLSAVDGLPSHLCGFCRAALAKCVAFRDRCQRSTALLHKLLERGPLKMKDIKAIDRHSHKLTKNLTRNKVFQCETDPLSEIIPQIKTEDDGNSLNVADYTAVEYLEIEYCKENNTSDADNTSKGATVQKKAKLNKIKLENENFPIYSEINAIKTKVENTDVDSDTSEETINIRKKVELIKNIKTTKSVDVENLNDMSAFEKKFKVTYKRLSKEEQKQEIEERKRRNKMKYCCDLCGKGFQHESVMVNHLAYHDPSMGPYECDVCHRRIPLQYKLIRHRNRHRDAFTCAECGHVSRSRDFVKAHSQFHEGRSHTCPHCDEVYSRKVSYYNHVRAAHPERNVACDECGETFLSAHGVRMHKSFRHRPIDKTNFKCAVCEVTFSSPEALQKHSESSVAVSHAALFPCVACGESCGSDAARSAHKARVHPPGQHHCDECNKTFSSAASFDLHVERKHLGLRSFAAPFRRKGGGRQGRAGSGALCFVCETCGRTFKSAAALQYHRNAHLGIKPYTCPLCPKTFSNKYIKESHVRVHTGERPFQCSQCPRSFSVRNNLARHVENVHLRKQATCDVCGKSMGASSLWLHMSTVHLNKPPPPRKRDRKNERKRPRYTES